MMKITQKLIFKRQFIELENTAELEVQLLNILMNMHLNFPVVLLKHETCSSFVHFSYYDVVW